MPMLHGMQYAVVRPLLLAAYALAEKVLQQHSYDLGLPVGLPDDAVAAAGHCGQGAAV